MKYLKEWEGFATSYSELAASQKPVFLSRVAHQITVCARDAYELGAEDAKQKLMTLNEVMHNLTAEIRNHLVDGADRYPDDVLMDIIRSKAEEGNCIDYLVYSFRFAFARSLTPESQGR